MDVTPGSALLRQVRLEDLLAYLQLTGWTTQPEADERWLVYHRAGGGATEPVTLPRVRTDPELPIHLAATLNTLSALSDLAPEALVQRIALHDSDLLMVRDLDTGERMTLPLQLAATQVMQLAQLVLYAACAEQKVLPHFTHTSFAAAQRMVEHFRLGLAPGDRFGFAVQSRLVHQPILFRQRSFLAEVPEEIVFAPIERRIMERIVRGLVYTRQVSEDHNLDEFMRSYAEGFNANMCEALVRLSRNKTVPTEYEVQWSLKMPPPDDLREPGTIRLHQLAYDLLEEAARELKRMEPRRAVVRGMVVALSARDNPLGTREIARTVAIKWTNRPGGRTVNVLVNLKKEDYVTAHAAHLHWDTVEVTGVVQRGGSVWRLSDPRDFRVVSS